MRHNSSITAALLSLLVIGLEGSSALSQSPQSKENILPSSLRWYAGIAKAHGQSSVNLASTATHDYSPSLAESLRKDNLIRGVVVSQSIDSYDGFAIYRWYRVRVLSRGPDRTFINFLQHAFVPNTAKNVGADEVMVRISGGTAVVDRVTITQPGLPALKDGQQYLFFANKTSFSFYTLGSETTPVAITSDGSLDFSSAGNKLFARQLRAYHSYEDVQQLAMHTEESDHRTSTN